jgi:hypothetical protein
MKSQFLLPETVARHEGTGPEIALGDSTKGVLLTLGITRIIEQESLDLTIWGSARGDSWKQIAAFPQKYYCGTYSLLLNLAQHPDIAAIRAQWKMARWGRGEPTPLFGFYLFAEDADLVVAAGVH